jgi:tetratricopeptide (TPR) repeat protein
VNTQEAYQVLGLSEGATRSEVKKAYRKKQKKMERQVGVAATAINKQIGLQELVQLDESKTLLMPKNDETQEVQAPPVNKRKLSNYLSTTASLLVLVIIGLSVTTGKIAGIWESGSPSLFLSGIDTPITINSATTVMVRRKKAESLKVQYEYLLQANKLTGSDHAESINTQFLQAVSQQEQGAASVALINYQEVISNYQNLLGKIQPAIAQKALADAANENWKRYQQKNKIADISKFKALHSLKQDADKLMQGGVFQQAQTTYRQFVQQHQGLMAQLQTATRVKQSTVRARDEWHQYRRQNALGGEKISRIEKSFETAQQQHSQGLFPEATQSYQKAMTDYKMALAEGPKHVYEKMWLAKMRKRLAEIEAEPVSGSASQSNLNAPVAEQKGLQGKSKSATSTKQESKSGVQPAAPDNGPVTGLGATSLVAKQRLADTQIADSQGLADSQN